MQNKYKYEDIEFVPIHKHPKWASHIVPRLQSLKDEKLSGPQILQLIIQFKERYGWKRQNQLIDKRMQNYTLRALKIQYESELPEICRELAKFLLSYQPKNIKMMYGKIKKEEDYTSGQLFYVIVLMFFCLAPKQFSDGREHLIKHFSFSNDFSFVLSHSIFKTKCIVEYFKREAKQFNNPDLKEKTYTIIRNVEKRKLVEILKQNGDKQLGNNIKIADDKDSIEAYVGEIKVDFANRYLGGGCLTYGCVQQEIMFAIRPQILATTQLCQKMEDNEAIGLIGFPQVFNYSGYSNTTAYEGFHELQYEYDAKNRAIQYILAIDAIKYKIDDPIQFSPDLIDRQLLKAYIGFSTIKQDRHIVSGAWGCGVYNGDLKTKIIIQWIASSLAGKELIICPFGRKNIIQQDNFLSKLEKMPIGKVYQLLHDAACLKSTSKFIKSSIYSLMQEILEEK